MKIKQLTLACILASLTTIKVSYAADIDYSTPKLEDYTINGCVGAACLPTIDVNTGNNQINTFNTFHYLLNHLGFGLADFGANDTYKDQHGDDVQVEDISSESPKVNDILTKTTYLSGRFFINNLLTSFYSVTNNNNSQSNELFDISANSHLNDINKDRPITNSQGGANNGTNPIIYLDIEPYTYPPSSQILRNSLGAVSPVVFLNTMGTEKIKDLAKFIPSEALCLAVGVDTVNNSSGTSSSCLQPFVQLNTIAGYGYPTYSKTQVPANNASYGTGVPGFWTFLRETSDSAVLPSLNADTLLSPLTYNEEAQTSIDDSRLGLYGRTELAAADNFIRYLSGELLPNNLSTMHEYKIYQDLANAGDEALCPQYSVDAAMKIKAYRTMLRNYAAQVSVGTSNLYHLMQKRRKVSNSGTVQDTTSQMEEEYNMATYRIFNPTGTKETKWQANLKQASSSAIQKQMAMLLAEINYQLFLNRKEQERILVTLSAMQLGQNAQNKQQLTLATAARYISTIQIKSKDAKSSCEGTGDGLPSTN